VVLPEHVQTPAPGVNPPTLPRVIQPPRSGPPTLSRPSGAPRIPVPISLQGTRGSGGAKGSCRDGQEGGYVGGGWGWLCVGRPRGVGVAARRVVGPIPRLYARCTPRRPPSRVPGSAALTVSPSRVLALPGAANGGGAPASSQAAAVTAAVVSTLAAAAAKAPGAGGGAAAAPGAPGAAPGQTDSAAVAAALSSLLSGAGKSGVNGLAAFMQAAAAARGKVSAPGAVGAGKPGAGAQGARGGAGQAATSASGGASAGTPPVAGGWGCWAVGLFASEPCSWSPGGLLPSLAGLRDVSSLCYAHLSAHLSFHLPCLACAHLPVCLLCYGVITLLRSACAHLPVCCNSLTLYCRRKGARSRLAGILG
jgi:hypothetical protein